MQNRASVENYITIFPLWDYYNYIESIYVLGSNWVRLVSITFSYNINSLLWFSDLWNYCTFKWHSLMSPKIFFCFFFSIETAGCKIRVYDGRKPLSKNNLKIILEISTRKKIQNKNIICLEMSWLFYRWAPMEIEEAHSPHLGWFHVP